MVEVVGDETTGGESIPCPTCRGAGVVHDAGLTPREARALHLLGVLHKRAEVARQMGVSRERVAQLVGRAREKIEDWEARRARV